jgi:hypothetical protein
VLYLENHEYKEALQYLEPCVNRQRILIENIEAKRQQKTSENSESNGNHSSEKVENGDSQDNEAET